METDNRLSIYLTALGILLTSQIAYFFLPGKLTGPFQTVCRPVLYAGLIVVLYVFTGKDERPVLKSGRSNLLAGFGVLLYLLAVVIAGIVAGLGKNAMAPGLSAALNHIWTYGAVAVMSEVLRFKLIRGTPAGRRGAYALTLTLVYTFVQLDALANATRYPGAAAEFFFATVFPALALNAVLTHMAFEGSLASLLAIRAAYSLFPVFSPIVPNLSKAAWAAVTCAVLLVTLVMYRAVMGGGRQKISKKRAKYRDKTLPAYLIAIVLAVFLTAFASRAFAYFPVVVLTDSMAGAMDRGTVVFVRKLRPGDVYGAVREGDVIHYAYRDVEMLHRVTGFGYNEPGERVYITKGDANPAADAVPVETGQVLGVARASIPYAGYPIVIVRAFFSR